MVPDVAGVAEFIDCGNHVLHDVLSVFRVVFVLTSTPPLIMFDRSVTSFMFPMNRSASVLLDYAARTDTGLSADLETLRGVP